MKSFLTSTWPEQLLVVLTVFLARAFIVAGGSTLWVRFSRWSRDHQIVRQPVTRRTIIYDILHGVKILAFDASLVVLAVHIKFLRALEISSPLAIVLTFGGMFVWMEIYFYYTHRLFHDPRFFWIHQHHHGSQATNPWTSLSFSLMERSALLIGAVAIPALFSQLAPLSLAGYSFYFLFNYIYNVYGHLNVETAPAWVVRSAPGRVLNTTTYHALHHLRYRGHYGLFTQTLDRFHGSYFSDYEGIHGEAISAPSAAAAP